MIARANTTISIFRGENTDEYQDPQPNDTPVYTGIPASITTKSKTVFSYDSPTPRIVKFAVGRVGIATDVRANDTLKDERSGVIYMLESTNDANSPVIGGDLRLNLVIVQDK